MSGKETKNFGHRRGGSIRIARSVTRSAAVCAVLLAIVVAVAVAVVGCATSGPAVDPKWKLAWADEFGGSAIDLTTWTYDLGTGSGGWGNNELQYYTNSPANARVEGGCLVLTLAKDSSHPGSEYSSARLKTEGLKSARFGRIEARIRMPAGKGMFPAFWMMGTNIAAEGWPYCGEIDIAEMVGGEPGTPARGDDFVSGTAHFYDEVDGAKKQSGSSLGLEKGRLADGFHVYAIEWSPGKIAWFFDDKLYHEMDISAPQYKEFSRGFFVILNLAVGGNYAGPPDATTAYPQSMYVDYVRVYRDSTLGDVPPETPIADSEKPGAGLFSLAMDPGFAPFAAGKLVRYGGKNLPTVAASKEGPGGTECLAASYPGGDWGGLYVQLSAKADLSAYAGGKLLFEAKLPDTIDSFELKMESEGGSTSLYAKDYPFMTLEGGWRGYAIPLADFSKVNFKAITIPFSCWNPKLGAANGSGTVLFRGVRFEK